MFSGRFSASIGLVGVDFGTRLVKLLQLREHGRGLRVVGAGQFDIESGILGRDDPDALIEQLRGVVRSGGFSGRRCVVSLPRGDVRVQSVRLPKMPDEELQQAAIWEASQRFGFDRSSMEVDFILTGAQLQGGEHREEVLLIAASHEAINGWIEPLMEVGLRPVAIETHFTALARAFSRPVLSVTGRQRVRAVVDVGSSGATVMILRGDQIAFCKSIAIGGELFDQAVAEHLQMTAEEARELRAARFADRSDALHIGDPAIERAEYDAVRPLLGSFAKEVMLCIRYYGVTFRGHPPDRLILTGGDGLEPRLGDALAAQCKIEIAFEEEGSPINGIAHDIETVLQRPAGPAACWAVAAGLSLRGVSVNRLGRVAAPVVRQEAA